MTIISRLDKNTILSALKVQLKRLLSDKREFAGNSDTPVWFVMALNEEIGRVEGLIAVFKEEMK